MSRPIYEPNMQRTAARLNYGQEQLFRRPPLRGSPVYAIKVFADDILNLTGNGRFIFLMTRDMQDRELVEVEGYNTTAGTGATTVQVRNETGAVDMLSTPITIDSGDLNSKDASVQPVVDAGNATVNWGDHIAIDMDAVGTGSMGFGVVLFFGSV